MHAQTIERNPSSQFRTLVHWKFQGIFSQMLPNPHWERWCHREFLTRMRAKGKIEKLNGEACRVKVFLSLVGMTHWQLAHPTTGTALPAGQRIRWNTGESVPTMFDHGRYSIGESSGDHEASICIESSRNH